MSDSLNHPDTLLLDQWRAALLAPALATEIAQHVATCPHCQARTQFAPTLCRALDALPHPRLRPARAQPPLASMIPLYRLGGAFATLALVIGLSFQMQGGPAGMKTPSPAAEMVIQDPKTVDMLSNLEFYQWLAQHPELIAKENSDA